MSLTAPIRLGEYELLCALGSGGMATLYIARQIGAANVERLVAVKRVHRHVLSVPGIHTMFRDEARVAALVRHPNVVRVLDVCEVEGELLIVLDYVESVSLAALHAAARAAGEPLPVGVAVRVLADALAGLQAAHDTADVRGEPLGIVHRDFSPQNVLVGIDGTSQLIDFGVAKAAVRATQTDSGVLKGKFQYMSPEQARGSDIDRRSDVFAAGVVLFEALTGALPFGRDTSDPSAFLLRIVLDDIPPASSLRSELPVAIDTVVARALERVREERYQTAGEMRNALVAAVAPASDAEVRGLVELWSQVALAARRAEIRRALVGAAATVAQTPTGPRAETTSAPTRSEKPRSADATAPARPAPSERATGLAKIAVGAGAATAVVAVLAVGVLGGMLWRDRGGGSEIVRDTGSATPIAVDRAVPDANTTAPAAAAMLDAAPSDAGTLDAGPMDAGPMDAGMRDAVTTAATTAAVVTAHAAKPHTVAPPPTTAAPPRPRAAAGSASSATKTRIGFTADGALLLREHEVRLHMRLVRNTTQGDSAAIESRFDSYAWYTLKLYGQSVTVYLPHDTPPPAGTMTVTYHLRHNAFSPLPEHVSTFGLGDSFDAAVGGQAFMTYLATILDHGHADLTGEIVLEGTFAVK